MGFRNMPEQRCLLQGVLNPWHAGSPLWVLGLLAGPSAGARGWLFFRRGSRRARSSGDKRVLHDAVLTACTSEKRRQLPRGPGSLWLWGERALLAGVGELEAPSVSPVEPDEELFD